MPHLQAGNDADASSIVSVEKTPRRVTETPPIMAATKKQSLEIKGEGSYDSEDVAGETASVKKQVITPPSSGGTDAPSSPKATKGPILSIYGNTRLFSSPIQVNKRTITDVSKDESGDEGSSESQHQEQEKTSPAAQSPSFEKLNKEEKDQQDDSSVPSKKPRIASSPEPTKSQDQASLHARKPIISPTSSNDNKEDDESMSQFSYGSAQPYYGRQTFQHRYPHHPPPHHSPYHHPPTHPYGGHAYHQYPPGYSMYGGMYPPHHPPPPHAHYGAPPHPNMYYPPPPPQYHPYPPRHHMMSPIRVAQRQFPMRRTVSTPSSDASTTSTSKSPSPSPTENKEIASVTEWQRAAMSNGRLPSAKRCIPLTDPIPSKCWGPSDTTKDMKLPEFHRIVNYPDYLKARGSTASDKCTDGKKHCVMCGKERYSSASSLKGRTGVETNHIIPRQNKGLCTACDVTVWVYNGQTEIKWCKGCKNFRPWAAFGDKGSATKCTKCRERQKEKYALQKDAAKKWTAHEHLEAANGLRSLIHAATAN